MKKPAAAPETQSSLSDYLYVDRARIGALHTQLVGLGVPLQDKYLTRDTTSSSVSIAGGIPRIVEAKGETNGSSTDSSERSFDPSWPMVFQTVDALRTQGYVHPTALGVPVGSLVDIRGMLQILDLRVVHRLWEPFVASQGASLKSQLGANVFDARMLSSVVATMPSPIVAIVTTSSRGSNEPYAIGPTSLSGWGVINPSDLLGSLDSYLMMSGGFSPTPVEMLGVLEVGSVSEDPAPELLKAFKVNTAHDVATYLQHFIRMHFGRPHYYNGVTPLVISRHLRKANG